MPILDILKSLHNKGTSVTEALTSARGFFDASRNSALGDTALIEIKLGEQVEQLELSVPTPKMSYEKSTKGYIRS